MLERLTDALAQGSPLAFLLVFIAGLLSVATPCVLPMVPITLGIMGATKAASRARAILVSGCYALGVVAAFTALGVAFGLAGGVFGSWMGHPATAVAVAAVFTLLAVSSFGLFEIRLPSALANEAAKVGGAGPLGAFAGGLVAGVIAAPCIGPIMLAILAFVSTTQDAFRGAMLLASYGAGFSLPFVLVGAFAARLPKAGRWMLGVKSLFGVLLLLGAFWFLRGAFPALGTATAWGVGVALAIIGVAAGALTGDFARRGKEALFKGLGVGMMVVGGAFIVNAVAASASASDWCEQSAEAGCMPAACEANDRTIVVFGAEWCASCQELERGALSDPRVRARLERYGRVHVDVDRNPELADQAGIRGVPTIDFFDGECRHLGRVVGNVPSGQFLELLDRVEAM
jgi:thiol:disulfide interchange protein DsbD